MRGRELQHGKVRSSFIRHQAVLCRLLSVVASGELCQVPVVVPFPTNGGKCYNITTVEGVTNY